MGKRITKLCAFVPTLLHCASFLCCTGCGDEAQRAWYTAYKTNYVIACRESQKGNGVNEIEEGSQIGTERAKEALNKGLVWQIYVPLVWGGLIGGCLAGILIQYAILFACNKNQLLPRPGMFALVPALKRSMCFSIFDRRFRTMLELDKQLEIVRLEKNRKIAELQAIHELATQRIKTASNIEEMAKTRLVELSETELSEIVAKGEKKNQEEINQKNKTQSLRNVVMCQNCGGRIKFPRRSAGTMIKCPYKKCGHLIKVPSGPI